MNRGKAKGRREKGSFAAIPHAVLQSKNYSMLSFKAKSLLLDLSGMIVYQKGGEDTNGNLCAAFKIMQPLGWRSPDTLDAAEAELLHYGFIEVTQKGNRRRPTLYAVTWLAISRYEEKLIAGTNAPSSKWRIEVEPMPPRRPSIKKFDTRGLVFFDPIVGLKNLMTTILYPRIGLLTLFWCCFYTRGLGTSIDLAIGT